MAIIALLNLSVLVKKKSIMKMLTKAFMGMFNHQEILTKTYVISNSKYKVDPAKEEINKDVFPLNG
jgi:hypothetical protein